MGYLVRFADKLSTVGLHALALDLRFINTFVKMGGGIPMIVW